MDDDLNVAEALASLYGFQRTVNSLIDSGGLSEAGRLAVARGSPEGRLGPRGNAGRRRPGASLPRVEGLIREREDARRRRDYGRADEIRAQLKKEGITLEDKPGGGVSWKAD